MIWHQWTLDDYVGQEHVLGKDKILYRTIKADRLSSIIPVSYTHLDVYKRQESLTSVVSCINIIRLFLPLEDFFKFWSNWYLLYFLRCV